MRRFIGRKRWGAEEQLIFRAFEARDVEPVFAIQSSCPEIAQWSLWDYERVARGEMPGWAAEEATGVVGFIVARRVVDDIEILNFAVRPGLRRNGIGAALLGEVISWGKSLQAERVYLEVRAANLAALRFYEKHNFQITGRRPHYYAAPTDDALLLTGELV